MSWKTKHAKNNVRNCSDNNIPRRQVVWQERCQRRNCGACRDFEYFTKAVLIQQGRQHQAEQIELLLLTPWELRRLWRHFDSAGSLQGSSKSGKLEQGDFHCASTNSNLARPRSYQPLRFISVDDWNQLYQSVPLWRTGKDKEPRGTAAAFHFG